MADTERSCSSCGFLARRPDSPIHAATFFEMSQDARRDGGGWWALQVGGLGTRTVPACGVGAFPILDEILAIRPGALDEWPRAGEKDFIRARHEDDTPERNEAAKAVFNRPRPECPRWFPHTPGLSPGQHLEAFQAQQLEQDRRAFETKLTQMQIAVEKRIGRIGIWIGVAAVILAVAQVAAALLGLTSESWVVQLFR